MRTEWNSRADASCSCRQRAKAESSPAAPSAPLENSLKHLDRWIRRHVGAADGSLTKRGLGTFESRSLLRERIPPLLKSRLSEAPREIRLPELLPAGGCQELPGRGRDFFALRHAQLLAESRVSGALLCSGAWACRGVGSSRLRPGFFSPFPFAIAVLRSGTRRS